MTPAKMMKAVVYHQYGSPEVLELEETPVPGVTDGEVLLGVSATAVNPGDWDLLHGLPYVLRPMSGLRRPENQVLGLATAGRIADAGSGVARFVMGDEVYAEVPHGGFAEYVSVHAGSLAVKPSGG